jgi:hypothetical protein
MSGKSQQTNRKIPKWFRMLCYFGLACAIMVAACAVVVVACISYSHREQAKTEARIRHYFGLRSGEPLTDSVIESNLLANFPLGTPVNKLEKWLSVQGLGVDGHSETWQTNQYIAYQVDDYSDGVLSMRHISVQAEFDDHLNVTNIQAYVYSYSL